MGSPFAKKSVPGAVRTELQLRSGKAGIEWSAKRYPWIHVTSMSSGCSEQLTSLKGGGLYDMYDAASNRPKPIVTQVQVKKQGELGTTRKATVNFTAFTDDQLLKLTSCYFIPGMSCRVEWGWSISAGGAVAPGVVGGPMPDNKAICSINSKAAGAPHYNGIQGMIATFSYNLTKDNTWDCSIEIIAATEALGGTKVNEYSCDCARKYENEDPPGGGEKKKTVENKSSLATMFHDLHDDFGTAASKYRSGLRALYQDATISKYNYYAAQRDEAGQEHTSFWEDWTPDWLNKPDSFDAYISWGTLEAAVTRYCVPSQGGKYTAGKLSSPGVKLKSHQSLNSSDPRICLIPGSLYDDIAWHTEGDKPAKAIDGKDVLLENIMINTIFLGVELKAVEDGDGNLRTFVNNVLRKINECCGNLWELDTVNNSTDCDFPVLSVVDTKVFEEGGVFTIPGQPSNSVIRDIKLEVKLAESMKTQALYSNGSPTSARTDAGGNCGANQFKGFGLAAKGQFKNLAMPAAETPPPCDCKGASPKQESPTFGQIFANLKDEVSDSTARAAHAAIIERYGTSVKNGDDEHCKGMVLPFEFSITLDGIGGFEFGQLVTCDRVPARVRESFNWQVTAVEHTVTAQDWTTTVNTVARYK